jgi:hypothetical protein
MATDFKDLRESRGKIVAEMRALLDGVETDGRDLTSEEQAQYDQLFTDQGPGVPFGWPYHTPGDRLRRLQIDPTIEFLLPLLATDLIANTPHHRRQGYTALQHRCWRNLCIRRRQPGIPTARDVWNGRYGHRRDQGSCAVIWSCVGTSCARASAIRISPSTTTSPAPAVCLRPGRHVRAAKGWTPRTWCPGAPKRGVRGMVASPLR